MDPQNVIPQPQPPIPPVYPPQSPSRLPIKIGIVLLFIAAITGAYYLGIKQTSKQIASSTSSPTPKVILTPTTIIRPTQSLTISDETANWKTYLDNKNHFEFKYPNGWFTKDLINLNNNPSDKALIYLNNKEQIDYSNFKISLTVSVDSYDQAVRFLNYGDAGYVPQIISSESAILQGHKITKAVRSNSEFGKDTGMDYTVLISLKGGTLYIYGKIDNKNIIDQILSTFKFL